MERRKYYITKERRWLNVVQFVGRMIAAMLLFGLVFLVAMLLTGYSLRTGGQSPCAID